MLIVTYAVALWLGLYLLRLGSWDAGAGLAIYALGLAALGVPGWWLLAAVIPAACWLIALWRLGQHFRTSKRNERWLLVAGSIFLALSLGSLLLPYLPQDVALFLVGVDLLLVGYAVAVLDAYNVGEAFLPAALRSGAAAGLLALVFGGQVGFAIAIEGASPALNMLLLSVVGASIALVVFAAPVNNWLDNLLFVDSIGQARAEMRALGEGLPRAVNAPELAEVDEATFIKYTRRALSNLNKPDKLVASPLMYLSTLESEAPLARATELRALLITRIQQLKPNHARYGLTDEWRYYNALYYPYVLGLRPYSRRFMPDELDEDARAVLEWLQSQVPERTLYNWQNAAAAVIARDLQSEMHARTSRSVASQRWRIR